MEELAARAPDTPKTYKESDKKRQKEGARPAKKLRLAGHRARHSTSIATALSVACFGRRRGVSYLDYLSYKKGQKRKKEEKKRQ